MEYTIIRDKETAISAGEYGLALDVVRTQIASNLAKVHSKVVTNSAVVEAMDVYNLYKFTDIHDEHEKSVMEPFFSIRKALMGLNSSYEEFNENPQVVLNDYEKLEESLKSLMEKL